MDDSENQNFPNQIIIEDDDDGLNKKPAMNETHTKPNKIVAEKINSNAPDDQEQAILLKFAPNKDRFTSIDPNPKWHAFEIKEMMFTGHSLETIKSIDIMDAKTFFVNYKTKQTKYTVGVYNHTSNVLMIKSLNCWCCSRSAKKTKIDQNYSTFMYGKAMVVPKNEKITENLFEVMNLTRYDQENENNATIQKPTFSVFSNSARYYQRSNNLNEEKCKSRKEAIEIMLDYYRDNGRFAQLSYAYFNKLRHFGFLGNHEFLYPLKGYNLYIWGESFGEADIKCCNVPHCHVIDNPFHFVCRILCCLTLGWINCPNRHVHCMSQEVQSFCCDC